MFNLADSEGVSLKMKNGKPFTYTSRELARLAKRILDADRKATFKVVTAS
jgi:hypothetical protein